MQLASLFVAIVLLSSVPDVVRASPYENGLLLCLKVGTTNGDQGKGSFSFPNIHEVLYGKLPYIENFRFDIRTSLIQISGLDQVSLHNCSSKYVGPKESTTCKFVVENSSVTIIANIKPLFYNNTVYNDELRNFLFKLTPNNSDHSMSGHFTADKNKKLSPSNIPVLTELSFDPIKFDYKNDNIVFSFIGQKLFIKYASSTFFSSHLSDLVRHLFQASINISGVFTSL